MNSETLEEKAQLYAFGMLPESEREEFEASIRSDRDIQKLVFEYQQLAELDVSSSNREPSFQLYSNIMEEIDGAPSAKSSESQAKRDSKLVPFLTWGGWAAAACAVAVFGLGLLSPTENRENGSDIVLSNLGNPRIVAVETPSEEVSLEDRMLELAGLAEAYWFSREGVPSEQLLEDEEAEIAQLSGGFTIYDRRYNIGFIAVENLPRESPDKSYHVWAKTSANATPFRAGTLPIGDESRGLFYFDLTSVPSGTDLNSISFFVTEEDSETPPSPSQVVVLSDL